MIIIKLFIIVVLFIYLIVFYNTRKKNTYICRFLNKKQAFTELFDMRIEPFLKDDNLVQLKLKLKNASNNRDIDTIDESNRDRIVKSIFLDNILEFTEGEKQLIDIYIRFIKENSLFHPLEWVFIKISDRLANNLPYTRNRAIVIYPQFIESLHYIHSLNRHPLETLIHEYIHVYQRYNRELFSRYYNDCLKFISTPLLPPHNTNIIANPDGLDYWMYTLTDGTYVYPVLLNTDPDNFGGHHFKYNYYLIDADRNFIDTHQSFPLKSLKEYTNIYCNNSHIYNIYHPNEISSDIITHILSTKIYNEKLDTCFIDKYNELVTYAIL